MFNQQPADQSGNTVFGNINDPNNTLVQFTSTQVLVTPAQGQSRIESDPDNILNNLITTIPGFATSQAIFNLDATADGSAAIIAGDQFGNFFNFNLPLSGSGQNFFTLTGTAGELIFGVGIFSNVGLGDVSQVRFGETFAVPPGTTPFAMYQAPLLALDFPVCSWPAAAFSLGRAEGGCAIARRAPWPQPARSRLSKTSPPTSPGKATSPWGTRCREAVGWVREAHPCPTTH